MTPGGIILVPGAISQTQADDLRAQFKEKYGGANRGNIAILNNNMKFEPGAMTAVDSELIKQLQWTDEQIPKAQVLLISDLGVDPAQLVPILHYDGTPITARFIRREIAHRSRGFAAPLTRETVS